MNWPQQGFPPPQPMYAPPPPQGGNRAVKWLAAGCGVVLVLACFAGVGAALFVKRVAGPGTELGTTYVTPGMPFTLQYNQSGHEETRVWLDLDVSYTQGARFTGPLAVRVNGTPIAQYNVDFQAEGECRSPVREATSSVCYNWVSSQVNSNGSLSGQTRMFTIPAQPPGSTIQVSGMFFASYGVTVRRLRVYGAQ